MIQISIQSKLLETKTEEILNAFNLVICKLIENWVIFLMIRESLKKFPNISKNSKKIQ
jgi:hypothetical protein